MSAIEIVQVTCKPANGDEFQENIGVAIDVILRDSECHGAEIYRGIEDPDTFTMLIEWTTMEDHIRWRDSGAVQEFREHIGHLLANPSQVAHFNLVVERP